LTAAFTHFLNRSVLFSISVSNKSVSRKLLVVIQGRADATYVKVRMVFGQEHRENVEIPDELHLK